MGYSGDPRHVHVVPPYQLHIRVLLVFTFLGLPLTHELRQFLVEGLPSHCDNQPSVLLTEQLPHQVFLLLVVNLVSHPILLGQALSQSPSWRGRVVHSGAVSPSWVSCRREARMNSHSASEPRYSTHSAPLSCFIRIQRMSYLL